VTARRWWCGWSSSGRTKRALADGRGSILDELFDRAVVDDQGRPPELFPQAGVQSHPAGGRLLGSADQPVIGEDDEGYRVNRVDAIVQDQSGCASRRRHRGLVEEWMDRHLWLGVQDGRRSASRRTTDLRLLHNGNVLRDRLGVSLAPTRRSSAVRDWSASPTRVYGQTCPARSDRRRPRAASWSDLAHTGITVQDRSDKKPKLRQARRLRGAHRHHAISATSPKQESDADRESARRTSAREEREGLRGAAAARRPRPRAGTEWNGSAHRGGWMHPMRSTYQADLDLNQLSTRNVRAVAPSIYVHRRPARKRRATGRP